MPRLLPATALCLLAAAAAPAAEEGPSPPEKPSGPDPYPREEVLTYAVKLKYGILSANAGEATMTVGPREKREGRELARLELRIRSKGWVRKLFSLDNVATSEVDVGTGGTVRFSYTKKERGETELEEFTRSGDGKSVESLLREHSGKEERRTTEVAGPVQDVLSFFYHLRRMKLDLGRFEQATVFQGHEASAIRLAADGLERFKAPGVGAVWALKVHPTSAIPGLFSDKGSATIWVEETTHVMLKMVVCSGSGTATMTLVKAEKSPLLKAPPVSRRRK